MNQKRTTRSKRRTVAQWQALFSQQAQSGLSIQAFCNERGIGYSTFGSWKSRLSNEVQTEEQATRFVELCQEEVSAEPQWDVELTLGSDIVLRVARHITHARKSLGVYFNFYNTERRHQSLDRRTPDSLYYDSAKLAA